MRDAKTGKVLEERHSHNIWTTAGKTHLLKLVIGESEDIAAYCGVGTGTTPVAVGDTALQTEIGRVSLSSYTRAALVAILTFYFGTGDCNGTWTEEGLLTAASSGTLLAHTLFTSPVIKNVAKTVTLTHQLTFS